MRRVLPSEGGSHEKTRLRGLGPRRAPREIVTSEQPMRALARSTMETNAAATCGPCCAAAECFRLKAEATRQTRLRGLGSRRAPREIVTSEHSIVAPGNRPRRRMLRTMLRCGGVLPPEGGSHGIDDQPPRHR